MPDFTEITDQTGRGLSLRARPRRIVSLVPSQTELLFDLGLEKAIKGVTLFCVHPKDAVKDLPKVGGTKKLKPERIHALSPDLIIANKEENEKDQVLALARDYPVYVSHVHDIPSALEMIRALGTITGTNKEAEQIAKEIHTGFESFRAQQTWGTVLYMIWRKPWMTVGGDTFIHQMLKACGLENVTAHLTRYPEIDGDTIRALNPDHIFLSSEPYPFGEKHMDEFHALLPHARIRLVDGEMFSWYGSRLIKAVNYLKETVEGLER